MLSAEITDLKLLGEDNWWLTLRAAVFPYSLYHREGFPLG